MLNHRFPGKTRRMGGGFRYAFTESRRVWGGLNRNRENYIRCVCNG